MAHMDRTSDMIDHRSLGQPDARPLLGPASARSSNAATLDRQDMAGADFSARPLRPCSGKARSRRTRSAPVYRGRLPPDELDALLARLGGTEPVVKATVGFPEQALLSGHGHLSCPMVPDESHRSAVQVPCGCFDAGITPDQAQ